ncbi:hypothetical protein BJ165DRAFT_1397371 [Panaeolus papilionaceus]|nr:hypothetical protein BJ165DRAFT_1397371 [Panaeolus papilionaceus]
MYNNYVYSSNVNQTDSSIVQSTPPNDKQPFQNASLITQHPPRLPPRNARTPIHPPPHILSLSPLFSSSSTSDSGSSLTQQQQPKRQWGTSKAGPYMNSALRQLMVRNDGEELREMVGGGDGDGDGGGGSVGEECGRYEGDGGEAGGGGERGAGGG